MRCIGYKPKPKRLKSIKRIQAEHEREWRGLEEKVILSRKQDRHQQGLRT
jgi:hypothetical protein